MINASGLSLAALATVVGMAGWFTFMARTHFSAQSPRTLVLFMLEGLSLALLVGTVVIVLSGGFIPPAQATTAILLACAAALLFASALRVTRKRDFGVVFGRTVPGSVVQEEPYRFIRHPLYTAYTLNWAACAVLSGSWLIAAAAVTIAVIYMKAAEAEEKDLLRSNLGSAYFEYKRRTGLIFPRVLKRR